MIYDFFNHHHVLNGNFLSLYTVCCIWTTENKFNDNECLTFLNFTCF